MVAARPILKVLRSRSYAAGPWRTSVLAVLLLALMYTHGVSGESAAGHAHPGASTSATQHATAAAHHHDGLGSHSDQRHSDHDDAPESEHAAHQCVSGHPEQGVALPAPCEAPMIRSPHAHAYAHNDGRPGAARWAAPPLPDSTVLRI
ncbi:DUF6153 family protein [Streptomyces sp. NPDC002994]|uniref:DUF6153 family protein n=1 Tax=Streptomyces sp. NPDC002994 TaxID=3154441 RepID=UPI0033BF55CA